MKRLFTCLSATLAATCTVMAADIVKDGMVFDYVSKSDHTLTLTYPTYGNGASYKGDFVVPSTITVDGEQWTVTAIAFATFEAAKVTSITIPATVTKISDRFAANCKDLKKIIISKENKHYVMKGDVLFSADGKRILYCLPGTTSYVIPEGTETLGESSFYDTRETLASVKLPSTLKNISDKAFWGCKSISSIEWPQGLETIGSFAFYKVGFTGEITLPDGLKRMSSYAFEATEISAINIPKGIENIGNAPFHECPNLTTIRVEEGCERFMAEDDLLYNIGINGNAEKLICCATAKSGEVKVKDGVRIIDDSAFSACTNLRKITLPASVETFNSTTLKDMNELSELTIFSRSASNLFSDYVTCYNCKPGVIRIPTGTLEMYKKLFGEDQNYEEMPDDKTPLSHVLTDAPAPAAFYDLGGRRVLRPSNRLMIRGRKLTR